MHFLSGFGFGFPFTHSPASSPPFITRSEVRSPSGDLCFCLSHQHPHLEVPSANLRRRLRENRTQGPRSTSHRKPFARGPAIMLRGKCDNEIMARGGGGNCCCSFKRITFMICCVNLVAALLVVRSLYTSFFSPPRLGSVAIPLPVQRSSFSCLGYICGLCFWHF